MIPALHPDPDNRLADGVVVETTLVARLLGLKVLRIDGTVLLSPARVVDSTTVAPPATQPKTPPIDPVVGNGSLALARRLLQENDELLQRLS